MLLLSQTYGVFETPGKHWISLRNECYAMDLLSQDADGGEEGGEGRRRV